MNPLVVISLDGIRSEDIENPALRIPHLRSIFAEGVRVRRLETIFPSVTWAIHSSVVTGCRPARTGIWGNSVYDRTLDRRVSMFDPEQAQFDRDQRQPHLFGALKTRGADVAAVCWPLTQGAASIRYNIPEFYQQEAFESASSPEFWAALRDAGFPTHRYGPWSADHAQNPLQDGLTANIGCRLLTQEKPGALFLHFLLVDSLQHDFGVGTPEAFWAIEYVDSLVGRVLATLEATGKRTQSNLVVFSDHGHAAITSAFYVDAWLDQHDFGGQPGTGPFVAVSNGGVGYVYNLGAPEGEEDRLVEALRSLAWVSAVWTRDQFPDVGLSDTDLSDSGRLPDVVFELAEDHFVMTGEGPGIVVGPCDYRSMHGYRPELASMQAFLAASGPGFRQGVEVEKARIIDIAPVINALYDLGMPEMDGSVPEGILRGTP